MARRGPKQSVGRARSDQERARLYQARTQWHADQQKRRVRDNVVAGVAGALIVVGAFASQAVHAAVTSSTPEPSPTVSPAPTVSPSPSASPESPTPTETTDE